MTWTVTAESDGATLGHCASQTRHIYVIDDDVDVRKSVHFLLSASAVRAWPFARARDFVEQLDELVPAPILLDLRMPDMHGLHLLEILKQRGVHWPVIIMTAHGDIPVAVRAMKLGAIEFLEKPFQPDALDHALAQGYALVDRMIRQQGERDAARLLLALMTSREHEVVTILTEGVQNKTVAHRLGISARTVEIHRAHALAKLGVKSIAEVLALLVAAESSHTSSVPLGARA